MKTLKKNWLQVVILALPFVAIGLFWNKFSARVPVHWNLHGQPNRWMNKGPGLLWLPVANLGMCALFSCLPRLDPKLRGKADAARTADILRIWRLAFTGFFCLFSLITMAYAAGLPVDMNRVIVNGVLILLLVIGNFLGNVRPNYFAGIRTPWTLEDPEIWRATHRLGARLLCCGCLLLLLCQGLVSSEQLLFAWMAFAGFWAAWGIGYSYLLFRRKARAG